MNLDRNGSFFDGVEIAWDVWGDPNTPSARDLPRVRRNGPQLRRADRRSGTQDWRVIAYDQRGTACGEPR